MPQNGLNKELTIALAGNHMSQDNSFKDWVWITNKVVQKLENTDLHFNDGEVCGSSREYGEKNRELDILEGSTQIVRYPTRRH